MNWQDMNEIMTEDTYLPISLIKHEPDSIHLYIQYFYYKLKCSLLVGWKKNPRRFKKRIRWQNSTNVHFRKKLFLQMRNS